MDGRSSRWLTAVLVACSLVMICLGGIGLALSAPRIVSESFGAEIQLESISTSLVEANAGGSKVVAAHGVEVALLQDMVPTGEQFEVGKAYKEALSVRNDGSIDEYVRVSIYRYWVDSTGSQMSKLTGLDPSFIELELADDGAWVVDPDASTEERIVLYYQGILARGDETPPLTKSLSVSPQVLSVVANGAPAYDGATFRVEAVVDAVQTHNAAQAMTGAWGRALSEGGAR